MRDRIRHILRRIPVIGPLILGTLRRVLGRPMERAHFDGSASYWDKRYSSGGHSGVGSYGAFAEFKAEVLNRFVAAHRVETVIEFGCGDGNQLLLADYPEYLGFDVSSTAVARCKDLFKDDKRKSFRCMNEYAAEKAKLTLSLDVIYHLVEDLVFEQYMRTLFGASDQYVIIYSSDTNENQSSEVDHVRHRKFTEWVAANMQDWKLIEHLPNRYPYQGDYKTGSFADFYIYQKHPQLK